jgi:hypothetical protein
MIPERINNIDVVHKKGRQVSASLLPLLDFNQPPRINPEFPGSKLLPGSKV